MLDSLVGNDPLSGIIAFFLVLIPLILVHELGHFLAARAAGITVLEFGIGFPPRITRLFTWRETEFTLNLLPLGGFVRPLGDDIIRPLDEEAVEKDRQELQSRIDANVSPRKTKSVNEAKPLQRILFMAAGALANFILAYVIFVIIALIGLPQPNGGSVEIIHPNHNSVFALAGLNDGDVILEINGQKFNDAQDFFKRLYAQNEEPVTLTIQRGESTKTLAIEITPNSNPAEFSPANYAQVAAVVEGAPADLAGMKPGDVVVAFNNNAINGMEDFQKLTKANAGQEVTITLERGDEKLDVSLVPRLNPPEGQGAMGIAIWPAQADRNLGIIYREGFIQEIRVPQSLPKALAFGVERVGFVVSSIVSIPAQIASGVLTPEEARPVSIVGISQIGGVALQQSIEERRPEVILNFIAMISVALGFFNLLPLPALDGGRIMFVLLEIVRGRPIAPEREGLVHLVGLALLLSLSVIIILNDVLNPVTNLLR